MTSAERTSRVWDLAAAPLIGLPNVARDLPDVERREQLTTNFTLTRRLLGLAIGSLLLAGCFSILLVFGRIPGLAQAISDPLFFKRCLVLHVDLALVVWFFAFGAALFSLIPGDQRDHRMVNAGFVLACAGVGGMVLGTAMPNTAPVLANYVPVIDNVVYVGGTALFFGGLLLCFLNGRLFVQAPEEQSSSWLPFKVTAESAIALRAAAVAYLTAVTTMFAAWLSTPKALDTKSYYELIFWGGGHVLQVANVAGMLAAWLLLLSSLLKAPVLSARSAGILFSALILPHLTAPLFTYKGTLSPVYRLAFTRLMQFGIAPVVLIVLGICIYRLARARKEGTLTRASLGDVRFIGFAASAALTLCGFALGSSIRNSNTMIPAHYHASIGAVTMAYMAMTYLLLKPIGFSLRGPRIQGLIPWQLALFGIGQVIFALGFGFGGMHGLSRKAYGAEQHIRGAGELVGLAVMGVGGLIAVAGGLMFLFLMLCSIRQRLQSRSTSLAIRIP